MGSYLLDREMGKFHIAICDDENFTCSNIENILINYAEKNEIEIEVDVFYSGEEFIDMIRGEMHYDILFLDIELVSINGIDVGQIIRCEFNDDAMQIIFISSKTQYAMQLFRIRPMDFIVKPFTSDEIVAAFEQGVKLIERGNQIFTYKIGRDYFKVAYNKIMYFQSVERKIKLIFTNGEEPVEFYGKLDEIHEEVPRFDFLYIHKSYLINSNYVTCYSYENVSMINGDILPISQSRRKKVRERILYIQKEKRVKR